MSCRLLLLLLASASGCERAQATEPAGFQGVVEFETTLLAFEVGGRVQAIHVEEGDRVVAGTPLATLDDELSRAQVSARAAEVAGARAELSLVRSGARREEIGAMAARVDAARANEKFLKENLVRQRALLAQRVVSQTSVDELAARLDASSAERRSLEQNLLALRRGSRSEEVALAESKVSAVEAAQTLEGERLERHVLAAPSAGELLDVHIEAGEVVTAGAPIATMADTAHPYVDVFVPQSELGGVAVGKPARVRVDAERATWPAKVEHVAQKTEFTPRFLFSERERPNLVVRVRVRVDDPKRQLHAGVPAFVTIGSGKP